jgi:hypothetical protein
MRRLLLAVLLLASAAATAHAGPVEQACMGVDPRLGGPCRGVEVIAAEGSALCRYSQAVPEEDCATPITPRVSHREVAAYQHSWLHRTLAFQYRLGDSLPLVNAPWIGTHNSFNTATERPSVSGVDANQQLSLTDQLDLDVRSLELDAHYINTPWANGAKAPVVCHGRGEDQYHAGCTTERLMRDRVQEIAAWLSAHPRQVVLLYIEDHLESVAGHDAGAAVLRDVLGAKIYAPPAGGACTQMPLTLTRDQVRAAGAQVVILGSCGQGAAWHGVAFGDDERARNEGGDEQAFQPYPRCDPSRSQDYFDAHFIRYFEDSTGLSAGVDFASGQPPSTGITPERAAAMIRCGVDLFGFDQLLPDDGRLAALAWSWADGEPRRGAGHCVVEEADARFHMAPCGQALPTYPMPRRGVDAQRLRDRMAAAGESAVYLRYP